MAAAKRPRLDARKPTLLADDDSAMPDEELSAWRAEVSRLTFVKMSYEDAAFPATQLSIRGKDEPEEEETRPPPPPAVTPGETPKCRCGVPATSATVSKDTANKGRQYFHCPTRKCGFFAWADGGEVAFRRGGTAAKLLWARLPPELHIVCDSYELWQTSAAARRVERCIQYYCSLTSTSPHSEGVMHFGTIILQQFMREKKRLPYNQLYQLVYSTTTSTL